MLMLQAIPCHAATTKRAQPPAGEVESISSPSNHDATYAYDMAACYAYSYTASVAFI